MNKFEISNMLRVFLNLRIFFIFMFFMLVSIIFVMVIVNNFDLWVI